MTRWCDNNLVEKYRGRRKLNKDTGSKNDHAEKDLVNRRKIVMLGLMIIAHRGKKYARNQM